MALPRLHDVVHASQLYPDRIRINYRYRLPVPVSYPDAVRAMEAQDFHRIGRPLHFRGLYHSTRYDADVSAFISIPGDRAFLNIYVDINPLESIHRADGRDAAERSLDGRSNWLPANRLRSDNRWVWDAANDLIWEREAIASELAEALIREFGMPSVGAYQGAAVDRMEVTCDFAAAEPTIALAQARPAFQSVFLATRVNALPGASGVSERVEDDLLILHGDWRAGTTFRLYAKTHRRIRLECEIRGEGFRNLGIARGLSHYESDLENFFGVVARRIVSAFNHVLRAIPSDVRADGSPLQLLIGMLTVIRDEEFIRTVIAQLAVNYRITSRLDGVRVRRLAQRGYLERVGHGLYRVAAQWRDSLMQLSRCLIEQDGDFRRRSAL